MHNFNWNQYQIRFKNIEYNKRRIDYFSYLPQYLKFDYVTKKCLRDLAVAHQCNAYRGYHLNHTVAVNTREKRLYNTTVHQMYCEDVYNLLREMIDWR